MIKKYAIYNLLLKNLKYFMIKFIEYILFLINALPLLKMYRYLTETCTNGLQKLQWPRRNTFQN